MSVSRVKYKPFIKWVGGKRQLLDVFENHYPSELKNGKIETYIEPFVGGGAVLFDILSKYTINKAYIFDLNLPLINTYKIIKNKVDDLLLELKILEKEYKSLKSEEQKLYYYDRRAEYNDLISSLKEENISIRVASLFIFLNRTCFNGLYRVNKSGGFNVPMGSYKNPTIVDENNLKAISSVLQKVEIIYGDYKSSLKYVDNKTFVYCDPPYRPIKKDSFKTYSESDFNDKEQIELAKFSEDVLNRGGKIMLSNSDPKNRDENDNFFEDIYKKFKIVRVSATRLVNSKSSGRKAVNELLIKI